MNKSQILFFDSGVGGLTLLHKALKKYPREAYIFYADSANMPYGDLSKEDVLEFLSVSLKEIKKHAIKAVVVSCNTINAIGINLLKEQIDVPVIGISATAKSSKREYDPRKMLILGTPLMINNVNPNQLIKGLGDKDIVDMLPMQELVNYAEEFDFDSPGLRRYLKASLSKINWEDYHTLCIACSHIMYFKKHIRDLIPAQVDIVDSQNESIANLGDFLRLEATFSEAGMRCFLSGQEVDKEVLGPYLNYLNANTFFQG